MDINEIVKVLKNVGAFYASALNDRHALAKAEEAAIALARLMGEARDVEDRIRVSRDELEAYERQSSNAKSQMDKLRADLDRLKDHLKQMLNEAHEKHAGRMAEMEAEWNQARQAHNERMNTLYEEHNKQTERLGKIIQDEEKRLARIRDTAEALKRM